MYEFNITDTLARGLGCAYPDRWDFYWCMGTILCIMFKVLQ